MAFKQLACERCELVPFPGPLSDTAQALLVNIDNDDALVERTGHRDPQPGVVDDVVQPLQNLKMKGARDVQQRKEQGQQCDRYLPPAPLELVR